MATQEYPNTASLVYTLLNDLRRFRVNSISGSNPALYNVDGESMYIYIKNLSPAQLSNQNFDVWRIQLPKRAEFNAIKASDKLFVLLGYDSTHRVYTTWNPYWCKQRLNVAESCSMYSRLSLQKKVFNTQQIERLQLQNDGEVICIPNQLLGVYLKNIRNYFPEETLYVPKNSSIQSKKYKEENPDVSSIYTIKEPDLFDRVQDTENKTIPLNKFLVSYNPKAFSDFLLSYKIDVSQIERYTKRLDFLHKEKLLIKHKDLFMNCSTMDDYMEAIKKLCLRHGVLYFNILWNREIETAMIHYLKYVAKLLGMPIDDSSFKNQVIENNLPDSQAISLSVNNPVKYELDDFGKLKYLDNVIIERTRHIVLDDEYPDWEEVIKIIKDYYPKEATDKMTPSDWMKLFDGTSWRGRRLKNDTGSGKKKTHVLRVEFPDGKVVEDNNVSTTYCEVIKYIGPEEVNILDIYHAGVNIVSKVIDSKYANYQRDIGGGWYVMTNSTTQNKYDDLVRIINEYGVNIKVSLVNLAPSSTPDIPSKETESGKRLKIKVRFPDGKVIQPAKVFEALIEVVKYAGAEQVHNLNIYCCNDNLILKRPSPIYEKACKDVGGGWLCNTYSDTFRKFEQIRIISEQLNLGLEIELV